VEQIHGDNFLGEISDFEIATNVDCRNSLNMKLKPDIHEVESITTK
jgi:hypothetical protein